MFVRVYVADESDVNLPSESTGNLGTMEVVVPPLASLEVSRTPSGDYLGLKELLEASQRHSSGVSGELWERGWSGLLISDTLMLGEKTTLKA